jgi:signal transduction histidine kinase
MAVFSYKHKKLRLIFIVYWVLLIYIIAALVWWFILLGQQNHQMAEISMAQISHSDPQYSLKLDKIVEVEKRKTIQFIGEGFIFFVLLMAGAVFVFRAARRQFKLGHQQQNFMMAITHELKTPIAVTKLNLETLQTRELENETKQRLIHNSIQEVNRLNSLCNNMLLASQMEAGGYSLTKESIDMSELIRESVHDFSVRFPNRHFKENIEPGLNMYGDRLLLQMAANNLIDNALKYSGKETVVIVSLKEVISDLLLTITDEGKGIKEEDKKKIFNKFYRISHREAKGTGLGLYLTKKIAEQHHAHIYVTDNSPAGSHFNICFKNYNSK